MKINEKNFEQEVLQASVPVVVDFQAAWCGYCRRLAPAVERLKDEFSGKLKVVQVDIDEAPRLAEQFEVETIPTLFLFQGGKTVDSVVNPGSQDAIEAWLQENQAL